MPRPLQVEVELSARELADLRAYNRERRRTFDEIHQWLLERGFTIGRTAAGNWKAKDDDEQLTERFSRSNELASSIKAAIAGGNFGDVADAAAAQLTQVVLEQATMLQTEEKIDPLDVQRMTKSLTNLVASKVGLVKLLAERFDKEASKLTATKREITQRDLDEVRKAVFG